MCQIFPFVSFQSISRHEQLKAAESPLSLFFSLWTSLNPIEIPVPKKNISNNSTALLWCPSNNHLPTTELGSAHLLHRHNYRVTLPGEVATHLLIGICKRNIIVSASLLPSALRQPKECPFQKGFRLHPNSHTETTSYCNLLTRWEYSFYTLQFLQEVSYQGSRIPSLLHGRRGCLSLAHPR